MRFTVELPSGIYLAEIGVEGDGELDHHFTVFHRHNDLRLADAAEAVLKVVRADYVPCHPENVKTTRIVLVRDSLWASLSEYLQQLTDQGRAKVHTVNFTHSALYGVRDHAELAITFMNLANLPVEIEAGLDGLIEDSKHGSLVSVLLTLEMARQYSEREEVAPRLSGDLWRVEDRMPAELASVMASRLASNLVRDRMSGNNPGLQE